MSRDQLHHLSGAYVLNALDHDERDAFAACLADWEEMRAEVVELTDTAVALGLAVPPVEPSAGLRDRVLSGADAVPQWSAPSARPPAAAHQARRRRRRLAAGRARKHATILVAMTAAVLAVVLAVAVGHALLIPAHSGPVTFAQLSQAADARRTSVVVPGAAGIEVISSDRLHAAAIAWEEMPILPADEVYELWYMNDPARPAGVIGGDASGSGEQVLAGKLRSGDRIGLTIEPAGGSDRPTGSPVLVVDPRT